MLTPGGAAGTVRTAVGTSVAGVRCGGNCGEMGRLLRTRDCE